MNLTRLMDELVAARTWGASREYLLVHPELLQPLGARDAQTETEIAEVSCGGLWSMPLDFITSAANRRAPACCPSWMKVVGLTPRALNCVFQGSNWGLRSTPC